MFCEGETCWRSTRRGTVVIEGLSRAGHGRRGGSRDLFRSMIGRDNLILVEV